MHAYSHVLSLQRWLVPTQNTQTKRSVFKQVHSAILRALTLFPTSNMHVLYRPSTVLRCRSPEKQTECLVPSLGSKIPRLRGCRAGFPKLCHRGRKTPKIAIEGGDFGKSLVFSAFYGDFGTILDRFETSRLQRVL